MNRKKQPFIIENDMERGMLYFRQSDTFIAYHIVEYQRVTDILREKCLHIQYGLDPFINVFR